MTDHEGIPQSRGDVSGLTERESDVYRLRVVNRLTFREIGERLGIGQQRASELFANAQRKMPPVDVEALRRESMALMHDVQRRAYELAELAGAPVTAGKDGTVVYDPDTNAVVRDYGGRIAALRLAADIDKEMRKLHGLDAAQKVETTATVRYEIAGVDPDQLR